MKVKKSAGQTATADVATYALQVPESVGLLGDAEFAPHGSREVVQGAFGL